MTHQPLLLARFALLYITIDRKLALLGKNKCTCVVPRRYEPVYSSFFPFFFFSFLSYDGVPVQSAEGQLSYLANFLPGVSFVILFSCLPRSSLLGHSHFRWGRETPTLLEFGYVTQNCKSDLDCLSSSDIVKRGLSLIKLQLLHITNRNS